MEARGKDSPSSPQKDGVNLRREKSSLAAPTRALSPGARRPQVLSCQPAVTSISVGMARGGWLHFSGRPRLPPPGSHLGRCGRRPGVTHPKIHTQPRTVPTMTVTTPTRPPACGPPPCAGAFSRLTSLLQEALQGSGDLRPESSLDTSSAALEKSWRLFMKQKYSQRPSRRVGLREQMRKGFATDKCRDEYERRRLPTVTCSSVIKEIS